MSKTEKKKVGLTTRIFISLILGAIAGVLLHYFVPFGQDNPEKKPNSMIAHTELLREAAEAALDGKQYQPILQ